MVVHVINLHGVFPIELENDSPIAVDRDRPKSLQLAFERMKPPTGQTHLQRRCCNIEASQDAPDLFDLVGWQTLFNIVLVKTTQAFMSKASDQDSSLS